MLWDISSYLNSFTHHSISLEGDFFPDTVSTTWKPRNNIHTWRKKYRFIYIYLYLFGPQCIWMHNKMSAGARGPVSGEINEWLLELPKWGVCTQSSCWRIAMNFKEFHDFPRISPAPKIERWYVGELLQKVPPCKIASLILLFPGLRWAYYQTTHFYLQF